MALLAHAQHVAAARYVPRGLPDARRSRCVMRTACRSCRRRPNGMPSWIAALRACSTRATTAPAAARRRAARRLLGPDRRRDRIPRRRAARVRLRVVPPDVVPWLAAGLQVHWTVAVAALGRDAVHPIDVGRRLSLLRVAAGRERAPHRRQLQQGLRYLVCSLCATQWHMVRIKCSHCESTAGIGYLTLSDRSGQRDRQGGRRARGRQGRGVRRMRELPEARQPRRRIAGPTRSPTTSRRWRST